jgi:3-keto-L-gulonate-6-phosphate decarboxylase
MEDPTDEALIPTENERNGGRMGMRRKFTDLLEYFRNPFSTKPPPPPQDEDVPARKKPRLQVSLPAIASADADSLNPLKDDASVGADPVAEKEEAGKLKDAVEKHNGEDWAAISELVPGRTKQQCWDRRNRALDSKSDETTARAGGKWTTDEDSTLADAVKKHNGEDWTAIAALVPGRTRQQCYNRRNNELDSKSDETTARAGKWTTDEDSTLTDAVKKHNGADWAAIAALVPGRTKNQCKGRWHDALHSKSDETTARAGKWTADEDSTLTDAVKKHNGADWAAIAAMVPGRTRKQCNSRWNNGLDYKKNETTARVGTWTNEEDGKLKDAAEKHNGKDWAAIAALVPGRTKQQCYDRWSACCWNRLRDVLDRKKNETTARVGNGQQKKPAS